ncbi:hypothetical protein [Nitrosomonas marina]|uniref:hypothetical protein n=1 Tax=Nitrosomonas marina TaxID=917 RepID=UPI000B80942E|nr:hypothetical protein [Nitrosomonas marina]
MTSINRLPESWINKIFDRFHGRFGNAFAAKWQTGHINKDGVDEGIVNAKKVWSEDLAGYTPEEITRGLQTRYDFPPSVDQFMKACRPSLDYERAFVTAVEQMRRRQDAKDVWENPAIYWAAVKLGGDLNNYPYQSIKSRWHKALDNAVQDIRNGKLPDEVPQKRVELPAPGKTTIPPEEVERRFAKVHEILDGKIING